LSARLITIGVSHFCEKARWALDRAGCDYVEEASAPFFHLLAGRGTRPLFRDGELVLGESTAILQHLDATLPASKKLYPAPIADAVLAAEEQYDAGLGIDVRRVVYAQLAREAELFPSLAGVLAPAWQERLVALAPRAWLEPILRAYKATGGPPPKALARIEAVFAEASRVLETARYLVGDRFTAADLTFAALAAPLVFPDHHPAMPTFADLQGTKIAELAAPFRATRAGQHVLRMYAEHRSG
jgi:glutathione S-transferase